MKTDEALWAIKGVLSEQTPEDQLKIKEVQKEIKDILKKYDPAVAYVAAAVVFGEMQVSFEKTGKVL